MSADLDALAWPLARLHRGLEGLARALDRPASSIPRAPIDTQLAGVMARWMDQAATASGLEAEATDVAWAALAEFLRAPASSVLTLTAGVQPTYLLIVRGGPRIVTVLSPEFVAVRIRTSELFRQLDARRLEQLRVEYGATLPQVALSERRQKLLHDRLLRVVGAELPVGQAWLFRLPPGEPFVHQVRRARLFSGLLVVFLLGFAQAGLAAASWVVFGGQSLAGHLDRGRLTAWALLLVVVIPLQVLTNWILGELALRVSAPFKRRLIDGALRMSPDVIRNDGVGALLARVNESVLLEGLLVTGGVNAVSAIGDWVLAAALLSQSSYPGLALGAFFAFTVVVGLLGWRYHGRFRAWTAARLDMSTGLVERLVGHRTRVVQERRDQWHEGEDQALYAYTRVSESMDRLNIALTSFPRLLPIMGAIVIAPLLLTQSTAGAGALVFALVGVASAAAALDSLSGIVTLAARGRVAWKSVGPIFESSTVERTTAAVHTFNTAMTQTRTGGSDVLLEAHDVSFRYPERPRAVLDRCSLVIRRGDRVLLEGQSGGGKSTLAALLSGLRTPESGLLLVKGLDRHTLSPQQWRSAVAIAPQFHENHIFANSLAFNLLLGRSWPASPSELAEAREVCNELGLGALIERMPAGLFENVGETGWQLSHGEKSRVYVARAILQRSDVMIFDESFAALDPDTLELVLRCVMRRAPTLVAIAHP